MQYRTLDPNTGELVESYPTPDEREVEKALERAASGFSIWRHSKLSERRHLLLRIAALLEERATELAKTMALEMGKPLAEGEAEAKKCAWVCRYYAEEGEGFLEPKDYESDGSRAFLRFDPLGPILAIMPWNFPLWQVFRFLAPALTAGNVAVLKHAPSVPRSALAIGTLLEDAEASKGLFQNLFLTNEQAAKVMADPRIRGVTLTGSARAGKEIGSIAGARLKPLVMELGGSDPFIVFEDADIDQAAEIGALSRCINSGQSCIAAKRFVVHSTVLREFVDRFVEQIKMRRVGDPMDRTVQIGPLARADLRDELDRQVRASVEKGAETWFEAEAPDRGFFYPPTVLTNVPEDTPARVEELFGPVAVLVPFATEDEALAIANQTAFGLGASLWTENEERAERLVPEIEAGAVFVNGLVKSDPRLPFGGIKESGYGRELGQEGLLEFVNRKTVWIR
jgi:succinate-semialdehyde dehydrogenase/glutarate-semialdehyde dehydrogenase